MASLPVELRRTPVSPEVRAWVVRAVGSEVVRVQRLPGSSTSALHRLTLASGTRLVLRRYAWRGFLENEPHAPVREIAALIYARRQRLPVPEVVAADPAGTDTRDGVPVLLMTWLPGRPTAAPDARRLAEAAALIHVVDANELGHDYFPWYLAEMTAPPPLTSRPELWEQAIELWHGATPVHRRTFIHRDFHPGNLLWSRGRLTGIVDWANACRGPSGCDIAHCRANLRDLAGPDAADAFVAAYESITGHALDPYWIVAAHLEHDQAHWTSERLAADEEDLARAVQSLTG